MLRRCERERGNPGFNVCAWYHEKDIKTWVATLSVAHYCSWGYL